MKLLLTSSGVTNKSIAKTLFDLVGKKPEENDQLALKVVDGKVEIVSEGKYLEFN